MIDNFYEILNKNILETEINKIYEKQQISVQSFQEKSSNTENKNIVQFSDKAYFVTDSQKYQYICDQYKTLIQNQYARIIQMYKVLRQRQEMTIFTITQPEQLTLLVDSQLQIIQYHMHMFYNIDLLQFDESLQLNVIIQNKDIVKYIYEKIDEMQISGKLNQDSSSLFTDQMEVTIRAVREVSQKNKIFIVIIKENNHLFTSSFSDCSLNMNMKQPQVQQAIKNFMEIQQKHSYIDQFVKQDPLSAKQVNKNLADQQIDILSILRKEKDGDNSIGSNRSFNSILNHQSDISLWDINFLKLNKKQQEIQSCIQMFESHNFLNDLGIKRQKFLNLAQQLQTKYNYRNNAFHNFKHALTVTQGVLYLIERDFLQQYFDKTGLFALMLAALCHDTDHPATNNAYQVATLSKFAIKYNDESVLEQHHLSQAFKLILMKNCQIFSEFSQKQFQLIRKIMIAGIMATDMKQHFTILKQFQDSYNDFPTSPDQFMEDNQNRNLLSGFVIHTCDFSGSAKQFDVAVQWARRVSQEFNQQSVLEKKNKVTMSPHMMNLDVKSVMAKQEIGFLTYIVLPNWQLANQFFRQRLQTQVDNINDNICLWEVEQKNALLEEEKQK